MKNLKVEMYRAFVKKKKAEIKVLELEIYDLEGRIVSIGEGGESTGDGSGT